MSKVTLTINGEKRTVEVRPDTVLIDLLREDLHLTGTKQSCDRKGQCGACTVIVNGKAVRSCLRKVSDLEGMVQEPLPVVPNRRSLISPSKRFWKTFKFATIDMMPEMEIIIQETPRIGGPLGATGIGEMTTISTAPAVTNAIYNACGVRIHHLPATPDKLCDALKKSVS